MFIVISAKYLIRCLEYPNKDIVD